VRPTVNDIARAAGVSLATVDRVLNDRPGVRPAKMKAVQEAIDRLGYVRDIAAANLARGRTYRMAFVLPGTEGQFVQTLAQAVAQVERQSDARTAILLRRYPPDDPHAIAAILAALPDQDVAGVALMAPETPVVRDAVRALRARGVPVVAMASDLPNSGRDRFVGIDNVAAGRMAAETLIARGYRRLGFLGGPREASTTQDRLEGFTAAARARGIEVTAGFAEAYSHAAGRVAMGRLHPASAVEAWFCGDDVLSLGALAALQEAGLRVPEDVGLIGLNDMEMAGWANFGLTTIHQPFEAIVGTAVDLVAAQMSDPEHLPEVRLFPCHIVERRTLRPPP